MHTLKVPLFKAMGDETRMDILRYLLVKKEMSCQQLMKKFSLSQPTLSHHFNKLIRAGIINARKEGTLWFYSLNKKFLNKSGININKIASH